MTKQTITREQYENLKQRLEMEIAAKNHALALAGDYKAKYIDSRRELKEAENRYKGLTRKMESLERTKAVGQSFADKCAQQTEEIMRLNTLLEAYREVLDLTGVSKDDIVLALAKYR